MNTSDLKGWEETTSNYKNIKSDDEDSNYDIISDDNETDSDSDNESDIYLESSTGGETETETETETDTDSLKRFKTKSNSTAQKTKGYKKQNFKKIMVIEDLLPE
tara:strand:- start:135 stop:449 length:315 start_codon:yes stop_codon:yes gene_type:complete